LPELGVAAIRESGVRAQVVGFAPARKMEDELWTRLSIFRWFNRSSLRLVELVPVAVVIGVACALQRDLVRGLRSAFLLRRLRFGGGRGLAASLAWVVWALLIGFTI
jgi:hypothetical protein